MEKYIRLPFYHALDRYNSLENQDEAISHLLEEWGQQKDQLEELYKNRDQKNTVQGMMKGIAIFIHFLYWSNDQKIPDDEPLQLMFLTMKPVNIEERLGFIISRPNLFHSFRQLSELIIELEKLYAKKKAKKRLN